MAVNYSLEKFSDDFLKARFDPKLKDTFETNLDNSPASSAQKFTISFRGDLSSQFSTELKSMFGALFQFASNINMISHLCEFKIIVFDSSNWRRSKLSSQYKLDRLPALKTKKTTNGIGYFLILSGEECAGIDTINVARLLFSKIFGEQFFYDQIESKQPFANIIKKKKDIEAETEEKIALGRLFLLENEVLKNCWIKLGKKNKLANNSNAEKYGRNFFFSLIENKQDGHQEYLRILSSQTADLEKTPESYLGSNLEKYFDMVYEKNRIFHFILPHELNKIFNLKDSPIMFAKILMEKIDYAKSIFSSLIEEENQPVEIIDDPYASPGLSKAEVPSEQQKDPANPLSENKSDNPKYQELLLRSVMVGLLNRKLAHEFLIPESCRTKEDLAKHKKFPLKIVSLLLETKFSKPTKENVDLIIERYTNSIYQRAYNLAFLKLQLLKNEDEKKDSDQIKRLITINKSWFTLRLNHLNDLFFISQFSEKYFTLVDPQREKIINNLQIARNGWAHFISFALIDCYFSHFHTDKTVGSERKEKFRKIIMNHIKNNVDEIPYFRISKLYLLIYSKLNFDLKKLIILISNQCPHLISVIKEGVFAIHPLSDSYNKKIAQAVVDWLEDFEDGESIRNKPLGMRTEKRRKILN